MTLPDDWLYPEVAYSIVGGLYEVHTLMGPGFVHRIYANACYQELGLRGLAVKPVKRMQVVYKGGSGADFVKIGNRKINHEDTKARRTDKY